MCHQAMVGIMTLPPQPFHFCGTSPRIVSDCSRKAPHSAVEEANAVLVVIHQGVAGFAHHGLPVLAAATFMVAKRLQRRPPPATFWSPPFGIGVHQASKK